MKIDLSLIQKVNLEKLTKEIVAIDPNIEISRFKSSERDELIIEADERLTKEQKKAIKELVEAHNPVRDDKEEAENKEEKQFDLKLRAALVRLGVLAPQ